MILKDMILDPAIHPRSGNLSEIHLSALRDAVQAGQELPPLVVCQETHKLVEGWHRRETYRRLYNDDYDVDVEERQYRDDQERFLDALAMSGDRKLGLTPFDQARSLVRGQELGLTPEQIAVNLNVPIDTLMKRVHLAGVQRRAMTQVQLKAPLRHFEGRVLSLPQAEVNSKSDGMPISYHCRQIAARLKADMIDWGRPADMEAMAELRALLVGEGRLGE